MNTYDILTNIGKATEQANKSTPADPLAQWTLPVLFDRTADGPLIDTALEYTPFTRQTGNSVLIGDGEIFLPERDRFIGRRRETRTCLNDFIEGKKPLLLFTGTGGVGKTTLAGLFARYFRESFPKARILGFKAPFDPALIHEPIREEAFDGEEPELKYQIDTETDATERIRRMLVSLSKRRNRPLMIILDNLESIQDINDLSVTDETSHRLVKIVCGLPGNIRVVLTGRYTLPGLPENMAVCRVGEALYGDILRRMDRLRWPRFVSIDEKRNLYSHLGGNHRAIEWIARLLSDDPNKARELVEKVESLEKPPETTGEAIPHVMESMRQNLLFNEIRNRLTDGQDHLLRAASLYRIPVSADGLMAVESNTDAHTRNVNTLLDYSLMASAENPEWGIDFFQIFAIAKSLIESSPEKFGFVESKRQSLHHAMGRYHRFQAEHVTKSLIEYLEAIHHFRAAGSHEEADGPAEIVCNFYYDRSLFSEAARLAGEIVERNDPPAPWWALIRYGQCRLVLGFPDDALDSYTRALKVVTGLKEKGDTLNNIGEIHRARGQYDTALEYYDKSLEIQRDIDNKEGEGTTLNNIGNVEYARGDNSSAIEYLDKSLEIQRKIGNKAGAISTLHNMAFIAWNAGDHQKALKLWSEALPLALETENAEGIYHVAGRLGTISAGAGLREEAEKLLTMAINTGKQAGFPDVGELEETLNGIRNDGK